MPRSRLVAQVGFENQPERFTFGIDKVEVCGEGVAHPLLVIARLGNRHPHPTHEFTGLLVDERKIQVEFAGEVLVQHRLRDAGAVGDIVHSRRVVALSDEYVAGSLQELCPSLAAGQPRGGATRGRIGQRGHSCRVVELAADTPDSLAERVRCRAKSDIGVNTGGLWVSYPGGRLSVDSLLRAVVSVPGVKDARVSTAVGGDQTLQIDVVDGADEAAVARSVANLLDEGGPVSVDARRLSETPRSVATPGGRVRLERVQLSTAEFDCRAEVALSVAGATAVGEESAPATAAESARAAAVATARALDSLLGGAARCGVAHVGRHDVGGETCVVVLLTLASAQWTDRLVGSALVRGEVWQAAARATLAAANRRLGSLLSGSGSGGRRESGEAAASRTAFVPILVDATASESGRHSAEQQPDQPWYSRQLPSPRIGSDTEVIRLPRG